MLSPSTQTLNVQEVELPPKSEAVAVTAVQPNPNVLPLEML
jgi:hypothetical protein